jgi:hypothetical protein
MCLTIPVVAPNDATVITPEPTWMKLVGTDPSLLYGFHGSTASKQPLLSAAYAAADKKEKLSRHVETFYLVDMTYRAPEAFADDQHLLYGQLPAHVLDKTPFIVSRRLSTESAYDLGQIWLDCVKQEHGLRKVKSANINWAQAAEYMMGFPQMAAHVFDRLPKLKCILMPMRTHVMPAGQNVCWVGVAPKAKASKVEAEVRYKPNIAVNLKF